MSVTAHVVVEVPANYRGSREGCKHSIMPNSPPAFLATRKGDCPEGSNHLPARDSAVDCYLPAAADSPTVTTVRVCGRARLDVP